MKLEEKTFLQNGYHLFPVLLFIFYFGFVDLPSFLVVVHELLNMDLNINIGIESGNSCPADILKVFLMDVFEVVEIITYEYVEYLLVSKEVFNNFFIEMPLFLKNKF